MPSFMDATLAPSLYRRYDGATQSWVTYGRSFYGPALDALFTNRASGITNLGPATNASILVVGSGFGYLVESLLAVGIDDVYGIDPGGFYWDPLNDAEWAPGVKIRTAPDWIGSGTEVASLTALSGITGRARFNWIIDEDAAPSHSDAELPVFIAGLEDRLQGNAKGRIVHLVTAIDPGGPVGDSSQNWKTIDEWQTVAPDHTWVDIRTIDSGS